MQEVLGQKALQQVRKVDSSWVCGVFLGALKFIARFLVVCGCFLVVDHRVYFDGGRDGREQVPRGAARARRRR